MNARARLVDDGRCFLAFRCPGCGNEHLVRVRDGSAWAWNNSLDRPTLQPSVLVRSGHYAQPGQSCWCTWAQEHPNEPAPFTCYQCHSYVTDGRIQFLSDCSHALAGKTVDLEPIAHSMGAEA